ncbi:MAG: aspartate--tRNA ligase [Candidatus Methanoplasma sp.]|jgi:aspartyl-tRNA synthetase|nr:aspartate--tRNA ligase [Candidatus Methanoplasma sp.]
MRRTDTCGGLGESDIGRRVCLQGWVRFSRDHGGVAFIDLADRYGITQVVFDPEDVPEGSDAPAIAEAVRGFSRESAVSVDGVVRRRVPGTEDPRNPTGAVEVLILKAEVLNRSAAPPFELGDQKEGVLPNEDTRMRYRYLDLRRTEMIRALEFRCRFTSLCRGYLESKGFLEIETPILARSTPEGARDYIVPSRLHPGSFYALPQSPQLFKQLLMVGGADRYYQVARCFRDEDSRKDRQPEFTQLDVEMSFVESERDIQDLFEGLVSHLWRGLYGEEIETPFPRIGYREAMERFGSDKPDMRYGLEFKALTEAVRGAGYEIFKRILAAGGVVAGMRIEAPLAERIGRNGVDRYIAFAKKAGLGGLTWMRCENGRLESNIAKYFSPETLDSIKSALGAEEGDLVFLIAGPWKSTYEGGGALRRKLAEDLDLVPRDRHQFFWLVDCPMYEVDPVSGKRDAFHHPFVLPVENPDGSVGGACFDLCLDGNELGSGSLRIHRPEVQREVFKSLGMSDEKIERDFGFFMEALGYGAPPHGGMALGIDRFVSILLGRESIRDVIAFPKNKKAVSLLDGSPERVDDAKLEELQIMSLSIEGLGPTDGDGEA